MTDNIASSKFPRPFRSRAPKTAQLKFSRVNGWGGKRRGAGRPNRSSQVSHAKREQVRFSTPVHLTLKLMANCRLRSPSILHAFKESARAAKAHGLSILHFSILSDHIHLIAETRDNQTLASGMRSLGARLGKAIRREIGGKGSVFRGRYHLRTIRSPRQMKATLAYVLQNFARHSNRLAHLDEYSSASYFYQWRQLLGQRSGPILDDFEKSKTDSPTQLPNFLSSARSWLARVGWLSPDARKLALGRTA